MTKRISGPEALNHLDHQLARLRNLLNDAIATVDEIDSRMIEIQSEQVSALQRLASMRLTLSQEFDTANLDDLHKKALALLATHGAFIGHKKQSLDQAAQAIEKLEADRFNLTAQHKDLLDRIETRLAEVQIELQKGALYRELATAFDEADAIADRAAQKLAIAIDERDEKSAAYQSDPLFSYLWDRGFGTPAYKASNLIRWLDGWVARLCKFEDARPNFARLQDLTDWLGDHADETRRLADDAGDRLENAEQVAIEAAGIPAEEMKAHRLLEEMTAIDKDILSAEQHHARLTEQHAEAVAGEGGPQHQARKLLAGGFEAMSFPDLRRLAAETLTLADDEIVTALVKLRTEELSLELEAKRVMDAPKRLGKQLHEFETLRRSIKDAHFDSEFARIRIALFDDALSGLASGRLSLHDAWDQIQASVRRKEHSTPPGFGGRHESDGFETVNDHVDVRVYNYGPRRERERINVPIPEPRRAPRRKPRRRSGFSTGGGMRSGGGFKTGGGF